jgi:hypothetical protein
LNSDSFVVVSDISEGLEGGITAKEAVAIAKHHDLPEGTWPWLVHGSRDDDAGLVWMVSSTTWERDYERGGPTLIVSRTSGEIIKTLSWSIAGSPGPGKVAGSDLRLHDSPVRPAVAPN